MKNEGTYDQGELINMDVADDIRYTVSLHLHNNPMNYYPYFTAEESEKQRD